LVAARTISEKPICSAAVAGKIDPDAIPLDPHSPDEALNCSAVTPIQI